MCEFNQRMVFPPRGCHDIPSSVRAISERPTQWADRAAQLPAEEAAVIANAIKEAGEINADVAIYRYIGTNIIGLALLESATENVQVLEYPKQFRRNLF